MPITSRLAPWHSSLAMEANRKLLLFIYMVMSAGALSLQPQAAAECQELPTLFHVGVVLDFDTLVGKMCRISISMAIHDFYAEHRNYTTKLVLHERDSKKDAVVAASRVLELLKNKQVQAILGPLTSSQAEFVLNLASKTHVPIVSFSATSSSLSPAHFPYFIRAAMNDSTQASYIASILDVFGWKQVVPIYEDTAYGAGIVPYLVDAFHGIGARIPYRSVIQTMATEDQIKTELYKLKSMSTRVFVVHMSPALASLFFPLVREVGMMEEGHVWLITDGLTNLLDSLDPSVLSSMQGVLGVRPYVPHSTRLNKFTHKWTVKFLQKYPEVRAENPGMFSLWAYDAIWALATAAEKVKHVIPSGNNSTSMESLRSSKTGPKLLKAVMEARFDGLSGEFRLIDRQLQSSAAFQIINLKRRELVAWRPDDEKRLSPAHVKLIVSPDNAPAVPKGSEIPGRGKKLKVGVPLASHEYVKVETDPKTNITSFSGYCIEVFEAAMKMLPYRLDYEFVPFRNTTTGESAGTYNDLVGKVATGEYDAVVGDTTILSRRWNHVDFTQPFTSDSGWTMIVRVKDRKMNASIFMKPWTPGLWIATFTLFLFTGFVVWVIEHRVNAAFRGRPYKQIGMIFYFAFSTMAFAHRDHLVSNLSRFVVIVWVFVVLMLQSTFTANLTSLLTVQRMNPSVVSIRQLLDNGNHVGYREGSFIHDHLIRLGFSESKMKYYKDLDQYADALSNGTSNGGVSAIFDELPYVNLFLSRYCEGYTTVWQTQKAGGFGFVFPKGSPHVPLLSNAILNLSEEGQITGIENKWLHQTKCVEQDGEFNSHRISLKNVRGLFVFTSCTTLLALLLFLAKFFTEVKTPSVNTGNFWKMIIGYSSEWMKQFDARDTDRRNTLAEEVKQVALQLDDISQRLQSMQLPEEGSTTSHHDTEGSDGRSERRVADIILSRETGRSIGPRDFRRRPLIAASPHRLAS